MAHVGDSLVVTGWRWLDDGVSIVDSVTVTVMVMILFQFNHPHRVTLTLNLKDIWDWQTLADITYPAGDSIEFQRQKVEIRVWESFFLF